MGHANIALHELLFLVNELYRERSEMGSFHYIVKMARHNCPPDQERKQLWERNTFYVAMFHPSSNATAEDSHLFTT